MLTFERFSKVIIILLCLALLVILVRPLWSENIFQGHDMWVQIMFLKRFQEAFMAGQFPVYYINGLYPGWDGPHFVFYQPAFYLIFTFVSLLGFSNVASLNITVLGLWIFSGVFMYLFARKYFGNLGGILAGVFYILAPYHIVQVFVRASLAEFAAIAFIPAVFWGLSSLNKNKKARYFFLTAFFLMLFLISHTVTIIIFAPVISIYLGFLYLNEKNLKILLLQLLSLLLGTGMAAFSIIPAFLELKYSNLAVKTLGDSDFHNHFICLPQFFSNFWGYGGSFAGCGDTMPFGIGTVHWIVIIILAVTFFIVLLKGRFKGGLLSSSQKLVGIFIAIFVFSIFMAVGVSAFVWEDIPYIAYLQFPWRYLTLTAFSSAFLVGGLMVFIKSPQLKFVVCTALITMSLIIYSGNIRPPFYLTEKIFNFNNEHFMEGLEFYFEPYITKPDDFGPVWEKKMPERVSDVPKSQALVLSGSANVEVLNLSPADKRYSVVADGNSRVRFFTHYFPGWVVFANGKELIPFYENGFGYMDVDFEKGSYDVNLKFKDTQVRVVSKGISFMSLIVLILLTIYFRLKNKKLNI